jgi:hypothetical protein
LHVPESCWVVVEAVVRAEVVELDIVAGVVSGLLNQLADRFAATRDRLVLSAQDRQSAGRPLDVAGETRDGGDHDHDLKGAVRHGQLLPDGGEDA